jgi:hypothetical protein
VISFVIGKMQVHHLGRGGQNERRAFTVAWAIMHLTEHAHQDKGSVAATDWDAAGAPEIEITDEMICAGARAFYRWQSLEFGDGENAAAIIFRDMVLAAPQSVACRLYRDHE